MRLLLELAGDIGFAIDHIEKAERLNYLAYYDPLTGLANATLFRERLARFMDAAREPDTSSPWGSWTWTASRRSTIRSAARGRRPAETDRAQDVGHSKESSEIARVAATASPSCCRASAAGTTSRAWPSSGSRTCSARPSSWRGGAAGLGESRDRDVPRGRGRCRDAFKNAEAALNKAKESNEPYLFYTQKLTERVAERLSLENELRQALEKNEFVSTTSRRSRPRPGASWGSRR